MKLYTAFVCAVMMFTLSAHAGPAPREVVIVNDLGDPVLVSDTNGGASTGNSHIEFIGFSQLDVKGNVGMVAIRNACGSTSVGARMCTTAEIMNSTSLPARPAFSAWVRSSPIAEAVALKNGRVSFLDASGLVFEGDAANCSGWSSDQGLGMTLSPEFAFNAHPCDTSLLVACCGVAP